MENTSSLLIVALTGLACGAPVRSTASDTTDAGVLTTDEADANTGTLDAGEATFAPSGTLGTAGLLYFDIQFPNGQTEPNRGTNTLLVTISQPTAVVTGATVTVKAYMPSMPGMSTKVPKSFEQDSGVYKLDPFFVSMGGNWRVIIKATAPDGTYDSISRDWYIN